MCVEVGIEVEVVWVLGSGGVLLGLGGSGRDPSWKLSWSWVSSLDRPKGVLSDRR